MDFVFRRSLCACLVISLAGCATAPPNTPGAGTGQTYTPFVDMQGLDPQRYSADLADCRAYAQQIDAGKASMEGMIGGIIFGALVGMAAGGNARQTENAAMTGGLAGITASGGRAINKQETVIANCLAGRGYRVLAGATVPTNTAVPTPYGAPALAPSAPMAVTMTAVPVTPSTAQPIQQATWSGVIQPAQTPAAPTIEPGQYSFAAQTTAKQDGCHATPVARLAAKGPGFETYSVPCTNGDTFTYRCEFGNCRALR